MFVSKKILGCCVIAAFVFVSMGRALKAMTKADLINAVAKAKSMPQTMRKKPVAARVVHTIFAQMKAALARGEKVEIPGFGTFIPVRFKPSKSKGKSSSQGYGNPKTGQPIRIKASTTVGFRPAQSLKDFVGGKKK